MIKQKHWIYWIAFSQWKDSTFIAWIDYEFLLFDRVFQKYNTSQLSH